MNMFTWFLSMFEAGDSKIGWLSISLGFGYWLALKFIERSRFVRSNRIILLPVNWDFFLLFVRLSVTWSLDFLRISEPVFSLTPDPLAAVSKNSGGIYRRINLCSTVGLRCTKKYPNFMISFIATLS